MWHITNIVWVTSQSQLLGKFSVFECISILYLFCDFFHVWLLDYDCMNQTLVLNQINHTKFWKWKTGRPGRQTSIDTFCLQNNLPHIFNYPIQSSSYKTSLVCPRYVWKCHKSHNLQFQQQKTNSRIYLHRKAVSKFIAHLPSSMIPT
jgi:hypothetical protein